jgi:hypothetical protein
MLSGAEISELTKDKLAEILRKAEIDQLPKITKTTSTKIQK